MELIITKLKGTYGILFLLLMLTDMACTKSEEGQIKLKAPLRSYVITARLDNKQAGTDSQATGILKGTYSEKTKLFTYALDYTNLTPVTISINKGVKGAMGVVVIKIMKPDITAPNSPLFGEKHLSSLEERDLLKGRWFVTIGSAKHSVCEIRGQMTVKQNNL